MLHIKSHAMSDASKETLLAEKADAVVSPYSLFSLDNVGAMITSVQLTGENYNEWVI